MDVDESVGQEPPMVDDHTTHFLNTSSHVLLSLPSTSAILISCLQECAKSIDIS